MGIAVNIGAGFAALPARLRRLGCDRDITIPVAEGVVLLGDRWFPRRNDSGRDPILLIRTPYGRRGPAAAMCRLLARRGYQVLIVSCRGTFGSGGTWDPFRDEAADGAAVLAWLEQQPWFVDRVGTVGASYAGITQWAVAGGAPPWLRAMAPAASASRMQRLFHPGGSFSLLTSLVWIYALEHMQRPRLALLGAMLLGNRRVRAACDAGRLSTADSALVGHQVPGYQSWLSHDRVDDPWWADTDHSAAAATMPPTSLHVGWYDPFLVEQLNDYQSLRAHGRNVRLCVGPWTHSDRDGGRAAIRDSLDWMDLHLKSIPSKRPPVRVFVLGARRWLDLPHWPPDTTPKHLHVTADGSLNRAAAGTSAPSTFTHDPDDPTPGIGGAVLGSSAGAKDNRAVERRRDVVTFTSQPIADDLTIAGTVEVTLYIRPVEGDVFVRLCDVGPRGRSTNIADGILRLAEGVGELQPDGTHRLQIGLSATACTFQQGHRIRLQVSGGAHPVYARDRDCKVNYQLHHDPDHPSEMLLPVLTTPMLRRPHREQQQAAPLDTTPTERIPA